MAASRFLTNEERDTIRKLRTEGRTIEDISASTGRSLTAVRKVIKSSDDDDRPQPRTPKPATAKLIRQALKLRAKGLAGDAAGKIMHIHPSTYYFYLAKAKKLGLTVGATGASKRATNHRMAPIVLGAETVAQVDERRYEQVVDLLWEHLPLATKLQAIESLRSNQEE